MQYHSSVIFISELIMKRVVLFPRYQPRRDAGAQPGHQPAWRQSFLTANGLNLGMLLAFAAVIGFGGAMISLLMSKMMAKWSTGARVIESPPIRRKSGWSIRSARLANAAGSADAGSGDLRWRAECFRHRRHEKQLTGRRVDRLVAEHDA
jgi:Zn-dependent protease with chaperone function